MKEYYTTAPLPFQGQKRNFVKEYVNQLKSLNGDYTFIDLFGGSGLLSHVAKRVKPGSRVIYNDYDNYRERLDNIVQTNKLLSDIREIVSGCSRHTKLPDDIRQKILNRISKEPGFVDYITLSSSLLFSAKYVTTYERLSHESFYNNVSKNDYSASGYLDGIEVECIDYKELYNAHKGDDRVILLVDPPYLSTDVTTYTMTWSMKDYLDVLSSIKDSKYFYFTSSKSQVVELCEWMGNNQTIGNPFQCATRTEFNAHLNYSASYTDIMLSKVL